MKPSEVVLFRSVLPLIATFGRAELEFAAALIVRGCVRNGDRWQSLSPREIGQAMKADAEPGEPWETLQRNPFLPQPDFHGLVERGFARFGEETPDGEAAPIELTERGLEVLRAKAAARSNKAP